MRNSEKFECLIDALLNCSDGKDEIITEYITYANPDVCLYHDNPFKVCFSKHTKTKVLD